MHEHGMYVFVHIHCHDTKVFLKLEKILLHISLTLLISDSGPARFYVVGIYSHRLPYEDPYRHEFVV